MCVRVCVCVYVLGLPSAVCTLLSALLFIITACAQPDAMPVVVVVVVVVIIIISSADADKPA